jgi:hypothetical protein
LSPRVDVQVGFNQHYRWAIAFDGYNRGVKPLPAPHVPGKTEFERFDNAMRQVLSVSKEELLKREAREKNARGRKKQPKKVHEAT